MRILAFSPFDLATISGNVVTLRRLEREMAARDHVFVIHAVSPQTQESEAREAVQITAPDVLHFYHGYKTARLLPAMPPKPAVVTLSGTDMNHDFNDAAKRPIIEKALERADRILTYNSSIGERLRAARPDLAAKLRILPKGVSLGDKPFDLRGAAGLDAGDFVFLHAGGIRPVKNNLFAADALSALHEEAPHLRLVFAGPILDEAYGRDFTQRARQESWLRHLQIAPATMAAAYRQADVVLNTSVSEGLSNTLIEAMMSGRAILAADIPGNRDLLQEGRTGLLYSHDKDFQDKARLLLRDNAFRAALGERAREHALRTFSTEREVDALCDVYRQILT